MVTRGNGERKFGKTEFTEQRPGVEYLILRSLTEKIYVSCVLNRKTASIKTSSSGKL